MFDWLGDFGSWLGDSWDSVANTFSNVGDSLGGMFGGAGNITAEQAANAGFSNVADAAASGMFSGGSLSSLANGILPGEWGGMPGSSGFSLPGVTSAIGGLAQYMMGNKNASQTRDAAARAAAAETLSLDKALNIKLCYKSFIQTLTTYNLFQDSKQV